MIDFESELMKFSQNVHHTKRYISTVSSLLQKDFSSVDRKEIHKHHILPKSVYPSFKNHKDNLLVVPIRVHYILHKMLAKALGGKCITAFYQMNISGRYNVKNKSLNYHNSVLDFRKKVMGEMTWKSSIDGQFYRAKKDDARVLSGELEHIFKGRRLSEAHRAKSIGRVVVFDSDDNCYKCTYKTDEYFEKLSCGKYRHAGQMRDSESRNKTSITMKNRTFYNNGDVVIFVDPNKTSIPNGYVKGLTPEHSKKASEVQTNKVFYHNPITNHQIKVIEGCHPEGYIRGRINFGRDNDIMKFKYGINLITGEKVRVAINQEFPDFCCNKDKTHYFRYSNSDVVYLSSDLIKLSENFGITLPKSSVYKEFSCVIRKHKKTLYELGFSKHELSLFHKEKLDNAVWIS